VYSVQEDPVCVSVAYPFTTHKPVQEDPIRVSAAYSVQDDPHSCNPLKKTQVAYQFNPRFGSRWPSRVSVQEDPVACLFKMTQSVLTQSEDPVPEELAFPSFSLGTI